MHLVKMMMMIHFHTLNLYIKWSYFYPYKHKQANNLSTLLAYKTSTNLFFSNFPYAYICLYKSNTYI